jgi:hypothetical protein
MGARKLTPADLARVKELARQWGKVVVRHAFGESGPGLDVDLDQMEEVAAAAVAGLAAGTLEAATGQQAQTLGSAHACPTCGKVCPAHQEARTVQGLAGPFEHAEPACYCPTCRRDFFPSAAAAETGHARLHAARSAQNPGSQRRSQIA